MPNKIKNSNLDTNAVTSDSISYPLTTFSSTGIDDNATSTAITISSDEDVALGVTTPLARLTVADDTADADGSLGSQAPQLVLQGGTGNQNNRFEFGMDSSGGTAIGFLQARNTVSGAQDLSLNPNGGDVGIGTTITPEFLTINKSSDGVIVGVSINNDYPTTSTASSGTGSGIRFGVNDGTFTSAFGDARGSEILSVTTSSNGRSRDIVFKSDSGGTLGEKMRILAGGGITFNGDTAAANALDDYEEGTFTPIFRTLGGAASTITYSIQNGHYTKIGRMVYYQLQLTASSVSLGAGNTQLVLGGLPFSASPNWGFCSIGIEGNFTSTDAPQTARVEGSIVILQTNNSSDARDNIGTYVAATTLQNNSSIICGGCYLTNV